MTEQSKEVIEVEAKPVADIVYQPKRVLEAAQDAAANLKAIVKQAGLITKIGPSEHLQFEAWQTLGRFYGLYAASQEAEPVVLDGISGFRAKSVVMNKDGVVVSGAIAYCMRDEKNWKDKPTFQLASMAQTRASAKALRNCLAWVSVLAGYSPTPAEEMVAEHTGFSDANNDAAAPKAGKKQYEFISEPQAKRLYAISKDVGVPAEVVKDYLETCYGIDSSKKIKPEWYEEIVDWVKNWKAEN